MEEIFEKIQIVEQFANKKEQLAVLKEIKDNEFAEQKIQEEKEKIKCAGQELKDTIDAYLEGKEYEKATNNPDVAHNHLLELRGVICLTNIDNIDEKYVDIEKKRLLLYKDLKDKTPEQKVAMQKCYENLQTLLNREKNMMIREYDKVKEKEKHDSKNKSNIFTKIKEFFMSKFGRRKRLNEASKKQKADELRRTRANVAPMVEQDDDIDVNLDFGSVENGISVTEERKKENLENNLRERVKATGQAVDRRVKYGDKLITWKNGNITVIKDDGSVENKNSESMSIDENESDELDK
ncbi:unknown [Clostridium sp. CAG:470]|nr:MAG: hypothetical protein BHW03_02990 [Clostridium sp. 28_17]CDE14372.1 unknown [Clostridium sp. CAG:470]